MLRRRIFSAAMASVLALSSIAVVAQAEETTNKVVTKDQLKELVNVTLGDAWRADDLANYGSKSQEKMLDALEAADTILADGEADEEDYTVAYMMVMAVYNKLTIYTAEQLKALIDECQPIYDTNNIYNEELQDQRYDADTFGALEEALDYAKTFVTSTASSEITEAYEQLAAAKDGLKKLQIVSKSMFRNVLKQYEDIVASEYAYETWRRGAKGWADVSGGAFWKYSGNNTNTVAYGAVYDYVLECRDSIVAAYDSIDAIKGLTKTTDADIYAGYIQAQDAVALFNAFAADDVTKATKAGVQSLLDKYHNQLVYEYVDTPDTADITAQKLADAIAAVVAIPGAAEDDPETDVDETEDTLVGVTMYGPAANPGDPATLWTTSYIFESGHGALWQSPSAVQSDPAKGFDVDNDGNADAGYWKLIAANATVKLDTTVYVPVDTEGHYITEDVEVTRKATQADVDAGDAAAVGEEIVEVITPEIVVDKTAKSKYLKYQTISKNSKFDLAKLIGVTAADITTAGDILAGDNDTADYMADDGSGEMHSWGAHAIEWAPSEDFEGFDYSLKFSEAYALADNYLNGKYFEGEEYDAAVGNYIDELDTAGAAVAPKTAAKGNTKEWQLVYRALYYTITDKYEGTAAAGEAYTRADVKQLINDAWDLIDATGEAAIFNFSNVALVEARKAAVEWVADANSDKTYKEYTPGTAGDDVAYVSSTEAYKALQGAYNQLKSEYDALALSFGDIYDKLAEVAEDIDDGKLDATDDVLAAIDACAYALSVVDPITYTLNGDGDTNNYEDNAAFDGVREFLENNRLITWTDGDKAVNIAQVAEDLEEDAAKIYCKNDASGSYNPTHADLLAAYNALEAAIAAQAEPEFVKGDANGDKAVTPADAAAILKWSVGLAEIDEKAADFNEDGAVTPADASAILKYCVQ